MQNRFPGYYKPTEEEFKKLWENCIFSFDTNILLNVYRYSPKSRERLFEVWRKLNERIWLPHQVALEYLQERLSVISYQSKPYRELQDMLDDASKSFTQKIKEFSKRHSFSSHTDTKGLLKILENAHNQIKDKLKNSSASYPNLLESDDFWDEITQLFHEKVGAAYSEEELSKHFKKAEHRFKQQQPPGHLDAKKPETKRYGDVILWFQLIDYVKSKKKPLIFVTDDEKDDWWLKHKGKTIGPRPELIQEMLNEGGVEFYLYTGDRFLDFAATSLNLEDNQEVIKEAEENRLLIALTADVLNSNAMRARMLENLGITARSEKINPFLPEDAFKVLARDLQKSGEIVERIQESALGKFMDAVKLAETVDLGHEGVLDTFSNTVEDKTETESTEEDNQP
jgi:hypothetical protein